jgi:hypothetical protein
MTLFQSKQNKTFTRCTFHTSQLCVCTRYFIVLTEDVNIFIDNWFWVFYFDISIQVDCRKLCCSGTRRLDYAEGCNVHYLNSYYRTVLSCRLEYE